MIGKIFFALKKRIEEAIPNVGVYRYSAHVLNKDNDEPLYVVPSVHIQFAQIETKTMTRGLQQAEINIIVHVVCENYYDNETPEAMTKVIDYAEAVHAALHLFAAKLSYLTGLIGDDNTQLFNSLHRERIVVDSEPTNIDITEMQYKFIAYDTDNIENYTDVAPVNLNIIPTFAP